MKTPDSPAGKIIAQNEAGKRSAARRYWQTAGDRVLLYLRCLNFPAPQALELALSALKTSERRTDLGSGNGPVAEAMQVLYQLLEQQEPEIGRKHSLASWCECLAPSSPPIHRLPMVAEKMASAHWRSLLADFLNRFR